MDQFMWTSFIWSVFPVVLYGPSQFQMNKKLNVSKVTPENQSIYAVDAYKPYLRKLENSDKIIEAFIQFLEQR